ncbi:MAG TPA: alpha/beta fold hydrolase [Thermoanaerobaculia bacterium]|nr:alpha/beta fold hydrolase [Thermoanaerobaculia bacterium]
MQLTIRILLLAVLAVPPLQAQTATFKPHRFEPAFSAPVNAELGELRVPENRTKAGSRSITLRFIRFRSTSDKPGHPIVYLAGGPGGSGTDAARGTRFALVSSLREHGDVIAFDQRGTGLSEPSLACAGEYMTRFDAPLDRTTGGAALAAAVQRCAEQFAAGGGDVTGYNTRESAADLMDLRKALGAEKLVLWGISYGTHLSIATLREHGPYVDRVILAGIEGPDETYKLPSDQQTLMEEIARLSAKAGQPDLLAAITRVARELEARPKSVTLVHPVNGMAAPLTVGKLDFQQALSGMLFAPDSFAGMPDFVHRLDRGDWTALALAAARNRMGRLPSLMSVAMDCASGISATRRAVIADEAQRTLLGDSINIPFPEVCSALPPMDLGDTFRAPLATTVPALLISGTLDGRTRLRQAEELRRTMPNAVHLVIENAGHSDPLFLSTPRILEAMKEFLRSGTIKERFVSAPPAELLPLRTVATVADDKLARYPGTYRIDEKSTRKVVKAGSMLYTIRDGGGPLPLRPSSETEFFYEGMAATIRFELDPNGKVKAMLFRSGTGEEQRAVREEAAKDL